MQKNHGDFLLSQKMLMTSNDIWYGGLTGGAVDLFSVQNRCFEQTLRSYNEAATLEVSFLHMGMK